MSLNGAGLDLVNLSYIRKMYLKHGKNFLCRYYSKKELEQFQTKTNARKQIEFLAGRFAGKEAWFKATNIKCRPTELSILNDSKGKPFIVYESNQDKRSEQISISHSKTTAIAVVISNKE